MTATLERATLPPGTVTARLNGREFPTRGQHVIDFIETACVLTKDQWRGQPFTLEPWQKRLLYEAFELNPDTGLRRYRTIYIEVPKKQGKSELLAALCAYLLVADNTENPEIACGSNSEEQADLVFGAAKAMCELSPVLSPLVTCYRRQLVLRENPAAKIIRVSAKAKTNDGRNLSAVVEDELHEYDESGEQLHNVLTNGVATRRQPLNLMITTAGWDLETLCGRMHLHAQRVISGEVVDPTFYAKIYAAGVEDVNLDDVPALERALKAANPSYGVTVQLPFYLDQRRKGAANFKRYYLNIWTSAESQWLPDGAWDECAAAGWDFDPALPMYVGFDASTRRDSTAIVMTQKDDAGLVSVRGKAWERPIEPNTGKPVENWRVPKEEIKEYLRALCATWDVRAVAYDPWSFAWTADELEAEGIPMIEVPQVPSRLAPATQGLYELIVDRLLRHDGDPVFARHIRNAVPKKVDRGYILDKFRGRANDLAAALVTVTYELMQREEATEEAPAPSILFFDDEEVA
jgi:phage terminase large subunit-like protein